MKSLEKIPHCIEHSNYTSFYGNLHGFVSTKALRHIAEEEERVGLVDTDKTSCCCSIRTTYGLPCACELARYKIDGISIPLDAVHMRWRRLIIDIKININYS